MYDIIVIMYYVLADIDMRHANKGTIATHQICQVQMHILHNMRVRTDQSTRSVYTKA